MKKGIQKVANPGRELLVIFKGSKYARYPVATDFIGLGDEIEPSLERFVINEADNEDIICISAKVISIAKGLVVHESEVEPSWLAKFIVKFVKKWPNDPGYASPRKMQVAINQAGIIRITFALVIGAFLKLFGIKGYFYRIAGNRINAIDGFTSGPISGQYAILPPQNGDAICDELERAYDKSFLIMDGNNIDNNILGRSKKVRQEFTIKDLMRILRGNPQGQEDDGPITPFILLRRV